MKLSDKSKNILQLISRGHSYEQILSLHSNFTYKDIFSAAQEALELECSPDSSYQDRLTRIKQKHPNAYEPWTPEQDELLKKMHNSSAPIHDIASVLKRKPGAVSSRIRKLRIDE